MHPATFKLTVPTEYETTGPQLVELSGVSKQAPHATSAAGADAPNPAPHVASVAVDERHAV
jgi:hypothetical protein